MKEDKQRWILNEREEEECKNEKKIETGKWGDRFMVSWTAFSESELK